MKNRPLPNIAVPQHLTKKKIPFVRMAIFASVSLAAAVSPAGAQVDPAILNSIPTMTFRHEGGLNTEAELQFIKTQLLNGRQPWTRNGDRLGRVASLTYVPHPVPHVSQGFSGAADVGGADLINDAIAAYASALMWKMTANSQYADKAVEILNAWSSTLIDIRGPNWYLLAAWSGSVSPLAADIIRDYPGWAATDKQRYRNMLNTVYLPLLNKRYAFGNRQFAVCNALCAIGVFNEDRAAFYQGVHHWMSYLPCYIYMSGDGPKPKVADYWVTEPTLDQYYAMQANIFPNRADSWIDKPNNPQPGVLGDDKTGLLNGYNAGDATAQWNGMNATTGFFQGACAETLRDLGHVENSVSALFAVAEIGRVQGIDLYTPSKNRLAAFLEFQAGLRLFINPMPGSYVVKPLNITPTYEIGYNKLANALRMPLPYTKRVIYPAVRSAHPWTTVPLPYINATNEDGEHWMTSQQHYSGGFESLTHGELGDATDYALKGTLTGAASYSSVSQTSDVALQNTPHTASLWIKGSGSVMLIVRAGNASGPILSSLQASATSAWKKVSVPNFNSGANTQLTFEIADVSTTAGTVYIDDCYIGGTSSSATGLLANSGFQGRADYWQGSSAAPWSVENLNFPTSGLAALYRLESNATDSSSLNNSGVATGGLTYSADAREGATSGQYNGVGARVVIPDGASLRITGNLTIACWVNVNSFANNPNFVAKSFNDAYRLGTSTSGGSSYLKLILGNGAGTSLFYGSQPLPLSIWTHVAVTVTISGSAATTRFYVNGVPGNPAYATLSAIEAGTGPLVLGARQDATSSTEALSGKLDQVTIYNRALSAGEILQLAQ